MKKIFLLVSLVILLFGAKTVFAAGSTDGQSNCQPMYGGGEVCNPGVKFTINKMVQRPGKGGGDFVNNLSVNDQKFGANQNVNFKIVVQNTGSATINNLTVTDTLPSFVDFVSGNGNFDKNTKKLTFNIATLEPGKTLEFIITARTFEDASLPTNQAVTCISNNVSAVDSSGAQANDSSQFCIEKFIAVFPTPQVFSQIPPKSIPSTGPEMLPLIGLIPGGIAGLYLRKKAR